MQRHASLPLCFPSRLPSKSDRSAHRRPPVERQLGLSATVQTASACPTRRESGKYMGCSSIRFHIAGNENTLHLLPYLTLRESVNCCRSTCRFSGGIFSSCFFLVAYFIRWHNLQRIYQLQFQLIYKRAQNRANRACLLSDHEIHVKNKSSSTKKSQILARFMLSTSSSTYCSCRLFW